MPYYVFRVKQDRSSASLVEAFSKYQEASSHAKALRRDLPATEFIKLIYAEDSSEGERLVLEKHQPSSPVEEWEV